MPGDVLRVADDVDREATCWVPASVMSSPAPLSRSTRAASGDLELGFGGSVGTSSRQRTQPARARCSTRWRPEASMSRNLPCRVTSSTSIPSSADQRRVERLERAERREVDPHERAAVEASGEVLGQRLDLRQLGHGANLPGGTD